VQISTYSLFKIKVERKISKIEEIWHLEERHVSIANNQFYRKF
jgi:hypothetical protein